MIRQWRKIVHKYYEHHGSYTTLRWLSEKSKTSNRTTGNTTTQRLYLFIGWLILFLSDGLSLGKAARELRPPRITSLDKMNGRHECKWRGTVFFFKRVKAKRTEKREDTDRRAARWSRVRARSTDITYVNECHYGRLGMGRVIVISHLGDFPEVLCVCVILGITKGFVYMSDEGSCQGTSVIYRYSERFDRKLV